jgi:hypothetical protein
MASHSLGRRRRNLIRRRICEVRLRPRVRVGREGRLPNMLRAAARGAVGAVLLATIACDPGWHYEAKGGTAVQDDGLRFDVPSPQGVALRVYASAFTSKLTVALTIRNIGNASLDLISPRVEVTAGAGVALPVRHPGGWTCPLSGERVRIPSGQSCTVGATFEITPLVPGFILPRDNPALASVVVRLRSNEPKAFQDVEVPMTWMK